MRIFLFSIILITFFISCDEETVEPMTESVDVDSLLVEVNSILPNSSWNLLDTLDSDSLYIGWNVNFNFSDGLTGRQLSSMPAGFDNYEFNYSISNDANYVNGPLLHLSNSSREAKYVIHFISSSELLMERVESSLFPYGGNVFFYFENQ